MVLVVVMGLEEILEVFEAKQGDDEGMVEVGEEEDKKEQDERTGEGFGGDMSQIEVGFGENFRF